MRAFAQFASDTVNSLAGAAPSLGTFTVSVAIAHWLKPSAIVAAILFVTLTHTLGRAQKLRSLRKHWVIWMPLAVGLAVAAAFIASLMWLDAVGLG